MTDTGDGRVAAFVCAWNALQSAGDIRNQVAKQQPADSPLPDIYWAAVAEAAVFADLARADMPTGIAASAVFSRVETVKQATVETLASVLRRGPRQDQSEVTMTEAPSTTRQPWSPVNRCNQWHNGARCTEPLGHTDNHRDVDPHGRVMAHWTQDGRSISATAARTSV